jgi:hypothetical protein
LFINVRKSFGFFILATLMLGILAACGDQPQQAQSAPAQPGVTQDVEASAPTPTLQPGEIPSTCQTPGLTDGKVDFRRPYRIHEMPVTPPTPAFKKWDFIGQPDLKVGVYKVPQGDLNSLIAKMVIKRKSIDDYANEIIQNDQAKIDEEELANTKIDYVIVEPGNMTEAYEGPINEDEMQFIFIMATECPDNILNDWMKTMNAEGSPSKASLRKRVRDDFKDIAEFTRRYLQK